MFGFSGEHLLVLLVILLIFGPKRLPDLGHSIGRTLKNFKDAVGGNHNESVPPAQQIPPASASSTVTPASTSSAEKQAENAPVQPK